MELVCTAALNENFFSQMIRLMYINGETEVADRYKGADSLLLKGG
jgi:hypothetical protein